MRSTPDLLLHIRTLVEGFIAEDPALFIVDVRVKPNNNFKIFLDSDAGLTVEKCISVNRRLRAAFDAEEIFPDGDYSLEISSPGVDEPLQMPRQFAKNVGRTLEVVRPDDSSVTGILEEASEATLTLTVTGPKKGEVRTEVIPISEVKTATVQVVF